VNITAAGAKSDLPQGTLDLLILKIAALGPVHGYAIAQRLTQWWRCTGVEAVRRSEEGRYKRRPRIRGYLARAA